jgi:hypothetical protein
MLRRLFGPKRGEVTGRWRKLHNEVLHNLYSLQRTAKDNSCSMKLAGHVARIGDEECIYFGLKA